MNPHGSYLWSLQRPQTPHPLLPTQPFLLQQPQQRLLLVQQQQQPLRQSQLLPEPESQSEPQQPEPDPEQDADQPQLQLPQPQPGLPEPQSEPEPELQLSRELRQHEALSEGPPSSQLPTGRTPLYSAVPFTTCLSDHLLRVTDTECSWLLSSMFSWEGDMGYRDFYSFAKLLEASLSAQHDPGAHQGGRRGPPVESYDP